MSNGNDGGNAFPQVGQRPYGADGDRHLCTTGGMSLRDYFAAKAMQGLLACPGDYAPPETHSERAAFAYAQANAMLEARNAG